MDKRFMTGISFKFGSMKIIFRDAIKISANKSRLTFYTKVICTGNNVIPVHDDEGRVIGEKKVHTAISSSGASGIEHSINNPIYLEYGPSKDSDTKVTAYLDQVDEYEVIAGY
jgi:hypothetical protein